MQSSNVVNQTVVSMTTYPFRITATSVSDNILHCHHCGKPSSGGSFIQGVFYCPMCASIINRNNGLKGFSYPDFGTFIEKGSVCDKCSNNPKNGGSGICHCTLGIPKITY